ncbi:unnamed protein product [Effrenium voratum]|nr:unnamed protein product [Effrenium voratum]
MVWWMRFCAFYLAFAVASVDEYHCARRLPSDILDYLNAALAGEMETTRSVQDSLNMVDGFLQGFGLQVRAGAVGWANLFEPLQGCPAVFVAAEVAHGLSVFHTNVSTPPNAPAHFARALAMVSAWNIWFRKQPQMGLKTQLCQSLLDRTHLNRAVAAALRVTGCSQQEETLSFLFGCQGQGGLAACPKPVLQPLPDFFAFWQQLSRAFTLAPTLQMPWGSGSEPYMMNLMVEALNISALVKGRALYLEFGVFKGESINFLARRLQQLGVPKNRIFGFDSFQGLPEDWRDGSLGGLSFRRGSFAVEELPRVEDNVRLVRGWFNETVPAFRAGLEAADGEVWIHLLHVDCDLYSSALEVLMTLAPFLKPGSLLVFDELVNFPQFQTEELRAFFDFLQKHPWRFRVVHSPWFLVRSVSGFAELYFNEGISDVDLLQAAAFELVE